MLLEADSSDKTNPETDMNGYHTWRRFVTGGEAALSRHATASRAPVSPAAPSVCPYTDLTDAMATRRVFAVEKAAPDDSATPMAPTSAAIEQSVVMVPDLQSPQRGAAWLHGNPDKPGCRGLWATLLKPLLWHQYSQMGPVKTLVFKEL
jgi:hypothetical protein